MNDKKRLVMRIQKTKVFKEDAANEVLALFKGGVDIVIIEHPKSTESDDGERCNVFIRKCNWNFFGEQLWRLTNWFRVTPVDPRFKECLYAPFNYAETVKIIQSKFPSIIFEEASTPIIFAAN